MVSAYIHLSRNLCTVLFQNSNHLSNRGTVTRPNRSTHCTLCLNLSKIYKINAVKTYAVIGQQSDGFDPLKHYSIKCPDDLKILPNHRAFRKTEFSISARPLYRPMASIFIRCFTKYQMCNTTRNLNESFLTSRSIKQAEQNLADMNLNKMVLPHIFRAEKFFSNEVITNLTVADMNQKFS